MENKKREKIEFICYAIGLFIVSYVNTKAVYLAYIILIFIYYFLKNYFYNKKKGDKE